MGCGLSKEEPERRLQRPSTPCSSWGATFHRIQFKGRDSQRQGQNQSTIFRAHSIEVRAARRGQSQSISGLGPGINRLPRPWVRSSSGEDIWCVALGHLLSCVSTSTPNTHPSRDRRFRLKSSGSWNTGTNSVVSILLQGWSTPLVSQSSSNTPLSSPKFIFLSRAYRMHFIGLYCLKVLFL